jgi:hypothetical protein
MNCAGDYQTSKPDPEVFLIAAFVFFIVSSISICNFC